MKLGTGIDLMSIGRPHQKSTSGERTGSVLICLVSSAFKSAWFGSVRLFRWSGFHFFDKLLLGIVRQTDSPKLAGWLTDSDKQWQKCLQEVGKHSYIGSD